VIPRRLHPGIRIPKGVHPMVRYIAAGIITIVICMSIPALSSAESGYTSEEIIAAARDLGKKIEMSDLKIASLVENYKQVCTQDEYIKATKEKSISAVFVYGASEAGLLYKKMSGNGFILFKQSGRSAKIKLNSSSFGAQIGGSAEWGLGLVFGLKDPEDFGGVYSGQRKNATAVNSTTAFGEVFSNSNSVESKKAHDIMLILTGSGLSAGNSRGNLLITLEN
jgi:hypothetical protein